jgi:Holliday junction resolvasome RuvABC endonuclease subunit
MQTITEDFIKSITRKNVAAFDVATHTGYYTNSDYGVAEFKNNNQASKKMLSEGYAQHKCFRNWIYNFLVDHDIKVVAIEDVIFGHFMDFRKLCEFRGILFEVCETLDIPIVTFKPSDIKKHGTGNGNANKEKMIEAAEKRYHIDCEGSDDLADAIHIFMYFCHRYKL